MDGIAALGRQAGLTVIEDAAQAYGALYKGRAVGTLGAMGAFSLNSTKNLPAGEGGLFVTDSEELYARAARVRFDGLEPPSKWDASHPLDDEADGHATVRGWMYLPGELTAALARSQLQRLAETTARSQRNATRLGERLGRLPGVEPPVVRHERLERVVAGREGAGRLGQAAAEEPQERRRSLRDGADRLRQRRQERVGQQVGNSESFDRGGWAFQFERGGHVDSESCRPRDAGRRCERNTTGSAAGRQRAWWRIDRAD